MKFGKMRIISNGVWVIFMRLMSERFGQQWDSDAFRLLSIDLKKSNSNPLGVKSTFVEYSTSKSKVFERNIGVFVDELIYL